MNRKKIKKRKCMSKTRPPYLQGEENPLKPETPSWSELPQIVLFRIFKCLKNLDKLSMSNVCKTWHNCFRDPSRLRKISFEFTEKRTTPDSEITQYLMRYRRSIFPLVVTGGNQAIKFAKSFATYFHDVEIDLRTSKKDIASDWSALSEFLKATNLIKLKVKFCWQEGNTDLIKPLMTLIQDHPTLEKFTKLRTIFIDSVFLSEDLFSFWTLKCPLLSFLKIWFLPGGYVPTNKVWQALVKTHPHLLVELHAYRIRDADPDKAILYPAIPILHLTWESYLGFSSPDEVISFLRLLAGYHKTLEDIYMPRIWLEFEDGDVELVENVLSECKKISPPLKDLQINWKTLDDS